MDSVRVSARSGRVSVVAEERDDVEVLGNASESREGRRTTIEAGSQRVQIRVPVGVDLVVGTASGRVEVEGPLGAVAVVTEAGRVTVEQAKSLDVRTRSGRVQVGTVDGCTRIRSTSGRVTVAKTAEADVAAKSGRIQLLSVAGRTRAHCVSGRIDVRLDAAADVEAETVSGRITVRVPRRVRAHSVTGALPPGPPPDGADCTIASRSVSGRVSVEST